MQRELAEKKNLLLLGYPAKRIEATLGLQVEEVENTVSTILKLFAKADSLHTQRVLLKLKKLKAQKVQRVFQYSREPNLSKKTVKIKKRKIIILIKIIEIFYLNLLNLLRES